MTYVLLTRAPLYRGRSPFSHDLHVLGAPLTFVLSQDQTLQFESFGDRRPGSPYLAEIEQPRCCDTITLLWLDEWSAGASDRGGLRSSSNHVGDHAISRGS